MATVAASSAKPEWPREFASDFLVARWPCFHGPPSHPLLCSARPHSKMGEIAAETVIGMIEQTGDHPAEIAIEPTLVVRESTGSVSEKFRQVV